MNLTVHAIELDVSILNYQVELLLKIEWRTHYFNQSKTNYYKTLRDILCAQVFSTTYHVKNLRCRFYLFEK